MARYFKIVTAEPLPDVSEVKGDVQQSGGNMSITLGSRVPKGRIKNQHEGIRIVNPRPASVGDGGFLGKRFNRK